MKGFFEHFTNTKKVTVKEQVENSQNGGIKMTKAEKQNKRPSLVTYVYGQVYRGYLESGKANAFKITNINVRKWNKILGWMKKNQYIVDFEMGDTIETACDLYVAGFNEKDLLYVGYLKAIERNMKAEQEVA